jgi:hypothetical protein
MLPEISRRCLTCGAAVRAGSRFCQQCGKALDAEAAPTQGEPEERASEAERASVPPTGESSTQEQAAPTTKDWTPPTKEFAAFEQSKGVVGPQSVSPAHTPVEPPPSDDEVVPVADEVEPVASVADDSESRDGAVVVVAEEEDAGRAGDVRGRVARVREGTRARVGRMREEAIVVLEETPDDSGLRFVLAAAALFVVFVVLLFLSTTVFR